MTILNKKLLGTNTLFSIIFFKVK